MGLELEYNKGYEDSVYLLSRWLDVVKSDNDMEDNTVLMSMLDISPKIIDWVMSSYVHDILDSNNAPKTEDSYVRASHFFNAGSEHTHDTFNELDKEVAEEDDTVFSKFKFNYHKELDGLLFELVGKGYIVRFMSAYTNDGLSKGEAVLYVIKPGDSMFNLEVLTYRLPTDLVLGKTISLKESSNDIGLELVLEDIED